MGLVGKLSILLGITPHIGNMPNRITRRAALLQALLGLEDPSNLKQSILKLAIGEYLQPNEDVDSQEEIRIPQTKSASEVLADVGKKFAPKYHPKPEHRQRR